MRPVQITGITGTSPLVPLDVYATASVTQVTLSGAGQLQYTITNVFDPTLTIAWVNAPVAVNGFYTVPAGIRGVRATGMSAADVLTVSQQGIT